MTTSALSLRNTLLSPLFSSHLLHLQSGFYHLITPTEEAKLPQARTPACCPPPALLYVSSTQGDWVSLALPSQALTTPSCFLLSSNTQHCFSLSPAISKSILEHVPSPQTVCSTSTSHSLGSDVAKGKARAGHEQCCGSWVRAPAFKKKEKGLGVQLLNVCTLHKININWQRV